MTIRQFPPAPTACFVLSVLVLLAGCGPRIQVHYLAHEHYAQRPKGYPISITEYDYEEAYEEVAQVTTRAYDDRTVDVLGRSELRDIARRLGGDAVIQVSRTGEVSEEFGYRPGNLTRLGTRFVDHYVLSGIVVRFKREK